LPIFSASVVESLNKIPEFYISDGADPKMENCSSAWAGIFSMEQQAEVE
jgi:hypothetical protein